MKMLYICLIVLVIVVSVFAGYQVASEKYERKGKWYTAEIENPVHYEAGKAYVYCFRCTADEDGKVLSLSAFIYDDDMSPLYDGKAVSVPTADDVATWAEESSRDMKIELKY